MSHSIKIARTIMLSRSGERKRIMLKDGDVNLEGDSLGKTHRYLKDFFVSSIDLPWWAIVLCFALSFFARQETTRGWIHTLNILTSFLFFSVGCSLPLCGT